MRGLHCTGTQSAARSPISNRDVFVRATLCGLPDCDAPRQFFSCFIIEVVGSGDDCGVGHSWPQRPWRFDYQTAFANTP